MINRKATIKYKGYDPKYLKPHSNKRICVSCNNCGKIKWVGINNYNNAKFPDLCKSCSCSKENHPLWDKHHNNLTRKKMRDNHPNVSGKNHPNWKGGKETLICKQCGKEYKKDRSIKNSKFCSKKCMGKWNSENLVGKDNPNWKLKSILICKQCNKNFEIIPSRKNSKFCSKKCYDQWQSINRRQEKSYNWQGGEITLTCQQCGNGYKVKKYYKLISKFCSQKCQGKWNSINKSGKNSVQWQGGLSFGRYCEKFNNKFKELIRNKYYNKCYLCNKTEKDNNQKLSVHHVNYNKDCLCGSSCEFVPLCRKCHTKTNSNRQHWEDLIMNYLYPNRYFMGDL